MNYQKYRQLGNCRNLAEQPKLALKQFAKEDARDISMILPSFLLNCIPHKWLIPMGIAALENKKSHIYGHASKLIDELSYPVNRLVDLETEPDISFGQVPLEHLELIW